MSFTETAVVLTFGLKPILWHKPDGSSGGYIPDSRSFWEFLLANKDRLLGVAHHHPGSGWGATMASITDTTTFQALELGLGKNLIWPILSQDHMSVFVRSDPGYTFLNVVGEQTQFAWPSELRALSRGDMTAEELNKRYGNG